MKYSIWLQCLVRTGSLEAYHGDRKKYAGTQQTRCTVQETEETWNSAYGGWEVQNREAQYGNHAVRITRLRQTAVHRRRDYLAHSYRKFALGYQKIWE